MDVKLDVLITSFLKHAIVEYVRNLRDFTWGVHYRHLLVNTKGSLLL